MNCCNDFGTCESGLGCPCRRDEPAKVAPVKVSHRPAETGNIWVAEPEPIEPLSRGEKVIVWGTLLAFAVISITLMTMGVGYVWARWLA